MLRRDLNLNPSSKVKDELDQMCKQVDIYERQMNLLKERLESREEEFALATSRE